MIKSLGPARFGCVALGILLGTTAISTADTLNEALVTAYLNNPDLDAGRARLRAADELVPQALAGWRPSIFINSTAERVEGEFDSKLGNSNNSLNRTTYGTELQINQSIYQGGGIRAGVDQAENLVRAERSDLMTLEQDVLLSAVSAYSATWRDRSVLDLSITNERRLQRQLQATRDRFEVGEVARTDVAQAEARLARARSDIEQAKADLASSTADYRDVIGVAPGDLVPPVSTQAMPTSEPEAQAIAATNPSVVAEQFRLGAARDGVDVAFAGLLPSLDLRGELQYTEEPSVTSNWQRQAIIGLDLSIPLYQGGAVYSQVRQQRENVRQQRSLLESAMRGVQRDVSSSWEGLLAARAAIEAFKAEVDANEIALTGVQEEALVGQRTVLDVLDAEQELFEAQINLVRAQQAEVVASYQLVSATGELTAGDLRLDVQPFDDVAYYEQVRTKLFGLDVEAPPIE